MSNSAVFFVPAARCCARVLLVSVPSTPTRGERSAERRKSSVVARFGARRSAPGEARRASGGTRSPLGAPPWRFWAGGRASFSGISSGSVQRARRSRVVGPGGRGPEPPGAKRLRAAAAGRHSPLRLRLVSGRRPLDERVVARALFVVNSIL